MHYCRSYEAGHRLNEEQRLRFNSRMLEGSVMIDQELMFIVDGFVHGEHFTCSAAVATLPSMLVRSSMRSIATSDGAIATN